MLLLHHLELPVEFLLIELLDSLKLLQPLEDFLLLAVALGLVGFGSSHWRFRLHRVIQLLRVAGERGALHHVAARTHQAVPRPVRIGGRLLLENVGVGVNLEGEPVGPLLLADALVVLMDAGGQTDGALGLAVVLALHVLGHLYFGDLHLHLAVLLDELLDLLDGHVGLLQPLVLLLQGHELGVHILRIQALSLEVQELLQVHDLLLEFQHHLCVQAVELHWLDLHDDVPGTLHELQSAQGFVQVGDRRGDVPHDERERVRGQRVLQQAGQLRLPEGGHRLPAGGQAVDYFPQSRQGLVDVLQLFEVVLAHLLVFVHLFGASQVTQIQPRFLE